MPLADQRALVLNQPLLVTKREIRKPALYEALSFVEQYLEKKNWLVRRYRNAKG